MIHIQYGNSGRFYVTTEEKRIDTGVPSSKIRYLFKFTNNMSKSVVYGYGQNQTVNDRYTLVLMNHGTNDVYTGTVDFTPNGYWTYEIYEVSWQDTAVLTAGFAPRSESEVLTPPAADKGIVQGLVEKGKLLVSEASGEEEVQYTEHPEPSGTNYIYVS